MKHTGWTVVSGEACSVVNKVKHIKCHLHIREAMAIAQLWCCYVEKCSVLHSLNKLTWWFLRYTWLESKANERLPLEEHSMLWPKKKVYCHSRYNKNVVQIDAYTSLGPADVSTTQSITLDFSDAKFITLTRKNTLNIARLYNFIVES